MAGLFTRRNLVIAGVALGVLALAGVLIWTALRGGKGSIDGQTVQRIVQEDVLAEFSESLDVSVAEAKNLYAEKELLEAAERQGLTRDEFLSNVREVIVSSLEGAVRQEEINAEQAERALKMSMRAITNHL